MQPADPYDDPDSSNNSGSVSVSPGVNLTLANAADGAAASSEKTAPTTRRCGWAACARACRRCSWTSDQARRTRRRRRSCTRVSDTRLRCDDPAAGEIPLSIRADDPAQATALSVTAVPGGDFEQLSDGNVANLSLRASYDFSIGDLTRTAQSVSGDTDSYTLHTTIRKYPAGVGPLTYAVTGGRFAEQQPTATSSTRPTSPAATARSTWRSVDVGGRTRRDCLRCRHQRGTTTPTRATTAAASACSPEST